MARIRRFETHRWVGARDTMTVYDCDDEEQFAALSARIAEDDLFDRNLISAFAPDSLAEARNRGFRSPR